MPYKDPEEQRRYQRERLAERRTEWFTQHGPCEKCGTNDRLELDHIDPSLKINHRIWSWSDARRETELAKCHVLCHFCHKEKTSSERASIPIPHGTDSGYTKRKCRCELCREAHRKAKLKYRQSRKNKGLPYT